MNPALRAAHFQLTRRCNLACRFCGQNQGMAGAGKRDLPLAFWLRTAEELAALSPEPPTVTLWGGEPLLYPEIDELARTLFRCNIRLNIVTNGTLIDRHIPILAECLDAIYVSVDGRPELNDAVRGSGCFEKIRNNLELLRHRHGKVITLTTVSDVNVAELAELPEQLAALAPDRMVLGPLMYLTGEEVEQYRAYSRTTFGCDYPELEVWRRDDDVYYQRLLRRGRRGLVDSGAVTLTPHARSNRKHCVQPWNRVHIRHDGQVGFCTDYFGFSAGNLQEQSLSEIFFGSRAQLFREAVRHHRLSICNHCPWKLQHIATPEVL